MTADPYKYFRIEAQELVDELVKGVLDLEKGVPTAVAAAALLRHSHTLKGAARVVKQAEIADHAHAIEEILEPFRASTAAVPHDRLETVLGLVDAIGGRVEGLPPPGGDAGATTPRMRPDGPRRTVRTDIAELDVLLEGIGETHAQLGSLRHDLRPIERARGLVDVICTQLNMPLKGEHANLENARRHERAKLAAGELRLSVALLERGAENGLRRIDRELRQVRDDVERIRLVPARTLFTDLERAARDVAQAQDKRVAFEGNGGDVRLEAHVLGAAQIALQQIVRNAVAHGIESVRERREGGKPEQGRVTVEIAHRGRRAVFACHDDGRGIDLGAVREVARSKGLLADDTDHLRPEDLMRLLIGGGLSTSNTVTELSGRGIGLDVVRESAARLGGEITVTTEEGKGTTVILDVPLSVASFEVLAVEAAGIDALIPLDAVEQTLRVRTDEIHVGPHGDVMTFQGKVVPFLPLAELLNDGPAATMTQRTCSVVIVSVDAGTAAVGVSRLLGTSSIVARPLPDLVTVSPIVSGTWLDPEGSPRLVLSPDGLVADAQRGRQSVRVVNERPRDPILVVDDSLTTRMLEQSILESAGYTVEVATSGEEALRTARTLPCLLFLVDVEMPGMDGFAFVAQTRTDAALRDTPAILVTSRAAPEDRQRGFDAGASAYIAKGDFDQEALLELIRALTVA